MLPMLSKPLELVINKRLDNVFKKHTILNEGQYSFPKDKSASDCQGENIKKAELHYSGICGVAASWQLLRDLISICAS